MSPSIHTDDAAVTDEQVAVETTSIKTAEDLHAAPVEQTEVVQPVVETTPAPEPEPEAPKSLNDERQAILKARATASREEGKTDTPVVENETPAPTEIPEVTEPEAGLPPNVRRADDGSFVAVMKVAGEDKEVPFESIFNDAQRVVGANAKLQDRASLIAENNALKARLAQSGTTQPPSGVEVSAPSTDERPVITAETFNKALLDGDETAANAVVDRLNQQPRQVDTAQLLNQATQQAVLEIERKAALASVSMDPTSAEILSDPDLSLLANNYSAQLQNSEEFQGLSTSENIQKAVDMVKAKFSMFETPQPAEPALASRTAQKIEHAQANQALGTTQRQPLPVKPPVTPISTRARMRAERIAGA